MDRRSSRRLEQTKIVVTRRARSSPTIYNWSTKVFETGGSKDAKALLEQLGRA